MKNTTKILFIFFFSLFSLAIFAQNEEDLYEIAQEKIDKQEYSEALVIINQLLSKNPHKAEYYFLKAEYFFLNIKDESDLKIDSIVIYLSKSIELNPKYFEAYWQ